LPASFSVQIVYRIVSYGSYKRAKVRCLFKRSTFLQVKAGPPKVMYTSRISMQCHATRKLDQCKCLLPEEVDNPYND